MARTAWPGTAGAQIGEQLLHILREIVDIAFQCAAQRQRGARIGAGRAPDAQIDAAGKQRGQGAELFGDHQRAHGWAA